MLRSAQAESLRRVHLLISAGKGRGDVFSGQSQSDAEADRRRALAPGILDHAIGDDTAVIVGGGADEERELIAAEANQDVVAAVKAQQEVGERLKDAVAFLMAVGIVDGLEPGEIEEQAGPVRLLLLEVRSPGVEIPAIEAARERVAEAEFLEPRLHFFPRRDVAHQGPHASRHPGGVEDKGRVGFGGEVGSVHPSHGELAKVLVAAADIALSLALGQAALDPLPRLRVSAVIIGLGEDVARRHVRDVLGSATEHLAREAIHESHLLGRDVALEKGFWKLETEILQILSQRGKFGFEGVDLGGHGCAQDTESGPLGG